MKEIWIENIEDFAVVDDCDYKRVLKYKWVGIPSGYVLHRKRNTSTPVLMHRLILRAKPSQMIDHVNGDKLNNTRENLRFATPQQNMWNRKVNEFKEIPYKGVSKSNQKNKKYKAMISIERKNKVLGYSNSPIVCAMLYDAAAKKYYGEYARLNFPIQKPQGRE